MQGRKATSVVFFHWWGLMSVGKCPFTQTLGTWAPAECWLSESPTCFVLDTSQILCAYTCAIWKLNHIFSTWYHTTLAIFFLISNEVKFSVQLHSWLLASATVRLRTLFWVLCGHAWPVQLPPPLRSQKPHVCHSVKIPKPFKFVKPSYSPFRCQTSCSSPGRYTFPEVEKAKMS